MPFASIFFLSRSLWPALDCLKFISIKTRVSIFYWFFLVQNVWMPYACLLKFFFFYTFFFVLTSIHYVFFSASHPSPTSALAHFHFVGSWNFQFGLQNIIEILFCLNFFLALLICSFPFNDFTYMSVCMC